MNQDDLGLATGQIDIITLHDGRTLETHGPNLCAYQHCCIHNPSDHPLKDAPLAWSQELALTFRRCPHGSLHPDPDGMQFRQLLVFAGAQSFYDGWHPCCPDQCCEPGGRE